MLSTTTKDAANATANEAKTTAFSAKRDLNAAGNVIASEFTEAARRAGSQVRGFIDSANDQFSDVSDKVTGEIRSNPVRSSAIALGVGFILGALFRR